MAISIDKTKCIGCGTCPALYPDMFEMGEDGLARVRSNAPPIDEALLVSAIESCPTQAIEKG